ncbi:MAG: glycosyltransferase family 4 protein, partial [Actinobacteria bacterium]|nr:glycosyltransferase family 4 protein [Actinomycetota bacterium]
PRWARLLRANEKALVRSPGAYLGALRRSLGLSSPLAPRDLLWRAFYFVEGVALWGECHSHQIRHIHAHHANAAADVAMVAADLGTRIEPEAPWTWSFTMHGPTEFYDRRHYLLAEKARDALFVACISDFARGQLMAISRPEDWPRFEVVHVGIPLAEFTPAGDGAAPDGDPRILVLGRLDSVKGQAVLLEAFAGLIGGGRRAALEVAGAGGSLAELEAEATRLGIAERVDFLGPVSQARLRELYERTTIFCLPSFAEGVPVVLMEAMAMEVPVVTTRITGIPELVEDGATGILVRPGRVDQVEQALADLLDDPGLRARLGKAGRAKVAAEFDVEKTAARLLEIFRRRLATGSGGG